MCLVAQGVGAQAREVGIVFFVLGGESLREGVGDGGRRQPGTTPTTPSTS